MREVLPRYRTTTWSDTEEVKALALKADYLQGWVEGRYPAPPICSLLNIRLIEAAGGRATFECLPREYHYNPQGSVHGGLLSTLIDSACGIACMSLLPAGVPWSTVNLSVSFLKRVTEATGFIRCQGVAVHQGKRILVADAVVCALDGTELASGRATCMTLDLPAG